MAGAGLSGNTLNPLFAAVEGLGDGGVGLVAAGRAHPLILVVDAGRCIQRLFQASCTVQWAGSPLSINVAHRLWNIDRPLGADFLHDGRHGEEWRKVIRPDRLAGSRVQNRGRGIWQVGDDVVPGFGYFVLVQ